jgi:hypothetical protein
MSTTSDQSDANLSHSQEVAKSMHLATPVETTTTWKGRNLQSWIQPFYKKALTSLACKSKRFCLELNPATKQD